MKGTKMTDATKPPVQGDGSGGNQANTATPESPKASESKDVKHPDQGTKKGTKIENLGLVRVHELDPNRQLAGTSPYLDQEQRVFYERQRAIAEKREPDLENPPATQGTPYANVEALKMQLPPQAKLEADVNLPIRVEK